MRIFDGDGDYLAFERIVEETLQIRPMRICAYCLMPNHWHMVLWPEHDGDLAAFMQRLTVTHVARWQRNKHRVGEGHVYQGRFKSFPVETDDYFYQVVRYVERNPLRANLVDDLDRWRWSSFWRYRRGTASQKRLLSSWPLARPEKWKSHVEDPQTESEQAAVRRSINRGSPLGGKPWARQVAEQLNLTSTLAPRGRPRKFQPSNKARQ
ncbi:MAG: transposase [Planctomycetes bacterium]|nr:transposase [Planctomycetota bacterium]